MVIVILTKLLKFLLDIVLVVLFAVCGYYVAQFLTATYENLQTGAQKIEESNVVSVVLTEKSFQPQTVTIRKGTTVIFSSTTGKPFWPASNLHPSHELYAAFDPKEPIAPDQTWSFVFNKVGVWDMHDHIRSYFTGTITVVD